MNTMDSNQGSTNNRATIRMPDKVIQQLQKVVSSSEKIRNYNDDHGIHTTKETNNHNEETITPPSSSSSHVSLDQDIMLTQQQSSKQSCCDTHHCTYQPSRPILVGYAFGPKKMSTMSMVMAEASKAVSTVVTHILPKAHTNFPSTTTTTMTAAAISSANNTAVSDISSRNKYKEYKRLIQNKRKKGLNQDQDEISGKTGCCSEEMDYYRSEAHHHQQQQQQQHEECNNVIRQKIDVSSSYSSQKVKTENNNNVTCYDDNIHNDINNDNNEYYMYRGHNGDDDNIAADDHDNHYDESSVNTHTTDVGSMISNSCFTAITTTTSASSSSSSVTTATTITPAISYIFPSPMKNNIHRTTTTTTKKSPATFIQVPQHYQLMRVSFVPLDLNSPLEEQHGGKFDVILHKMTEDILCKSQLNVENDDAMSTKVTLDLHEKDAMKRIDRLLKYKNDHPACCLVDHPSNVEAVMSRSAIAKRLTQCLRGVMTKSGIKVFTPRYLVLQEQNKNESYDYDYIKKQIENAPFTYPLIIKPLTAAGTSESHRMGILLSHHGLAKLQNTNNSIIQEYANHDGKLYKVYVLGNKVWVFPRPSLPNLPMGDELLHSGNGNDNAHHYVDFDSQRPYPKLCDFNVTMPSDDNKNYGSRNNHDENNNVTVTSDEIRPIADCIRRAFGLELFGFDIIVTKTKQEKTHCQDSTADVNNDNDDKSIECHKKMYVVDVNYFPSYKEVTNFPGLLAQYLAQCGCEGRVRSFLSQSDED